MKSYFENIARTNLSIAHNPEAGSTRFYSILNTGSLFSFAGSNTFLNDMRAMPITPVMVYINDYTGRIEGTSNDNKFDRRYGHCYIVKKIRHNSFSDIETWFDDCKTLWNQIIAQINQDIHSETLTPLFGLLSVNFREINNQADEFYGIGISFYWHEKLCALVPAVFLYSNITILRNQASIVVTNNTTAPQVCTIFFRINLAALYRYQATIAAQQTHTFSHTFTEAGNTTEHIIDVLNNNLAIVKTATMPAYAIFTYGTFTQVRDGADIICSLPVTNNSVEQTCIVYFKLGDYLVQLSSAIAADATHTFTYTFTDVNSDVGHTITAHNSAMAVVGAVTVDIVAPFEMSYSGAGTFIIRLGRYVNKFYCDIQKEDLTYDRFEIYNYDTLYIQLSKVYSLGISKRIALTSNNIDYLYINLNSNVNIAQNQIKKLTTLRYLQLTSSANIIVNINELKNLKRLIYLYLYNCSQIYIDNEIHFLENLTYLVISTMSNVYLRGGEISQLTSLIYLNIDGSKIYINNNEIKQLTKLNYLYIISCPNVFIQNDELDKLLLLYLLHIYSCHNVFLSIGQIGKLAKLTYLYLYNSINIFIYNELHLLTELTSLNLQSINAVVLGGELSFITKIPKTSQIVLAGNLISVTINSNEIFCSHYIYFNDVNMSSASVDNVFNACYAQLLGGFVPVTKNINVAGASNNKVTAASLTARNYLLSNGYAITFKS